LSKTIFETSLWLMGATTMLVGKATAMEIAQALGQPAIASNKLVVSIDNITKEMAPDINSDVKNEKV